MSAASTISDPSTQAGPEDDLVRRFVGGSGDYYVRAFRRIRAHAGVLWSFNLAAAILGPVWTAARGIRTLFWLGFFLEAIAVTMIAVGASGNLGSEQQVRADRLTGQAQARSEEAIAARAAGADNAAGLETSAKGLFKAADNARRQAEEANARGARFAVGGVLLLILAKVLVGLLANRALERRFAAWRADRSLRHGLSLPFGALALLFCGGGYGLTAYRFAASGVPAWIAEAPANRAWQAAISGSLDAALAALASSAEGLFTAVTGCINALLNAVGLMVAGAPWPVTMAVILVLAWQIAGPRVAVFSTAALAYLAVLGFWEKSMETVSLLGTATLLCLAVGIPLGVWCGRSQRFYAAVRPVLDFMQTMPAFVYLIPVIALFGIGKPPGVIATMIFGTPPVVRLTALGIQGVPATVREAALAYGATEWFLLTRVDLPLALPSIMTGINQTILMCLSMVVIASLIGAKGLGEDVLNALQYAAVGQGLLAGIAILLCAMIIDRIVQGQRT
jgi:glycine betaine/proline transport system permease protein